MLLTLWLLAASTPADQSMTPETVCARALPSKYTVQVGETVESVAKKFQLKPATVLGANPAIQQRAVRPGDVLTILPKDGILYRTKPEERFPEIAQRFRVPPGTLFEINGCKLQSELFIPGVIWQTPPLQTKPISPAPSVPVPKPATPIPGAKQSSPIPILRLPTPPDVPPLPAQTKKGKKKLS